MKKLIGGFIVFFYFIHGNPIFAASLVIGLSADVTSMDPHHHNLGPNLNFAEQVFTALLVNDERQRLVPALAESWRAIDETTWEFKLRRGVKFHNGSEFTAEDVRFSVERTRTGQLAVFTRAIVNQRVMDRHTIQFKTNTPYPNLPTDLRAVPILSAAAATGMSSSDFDSGKAMVGAGPYKFVRFVRGEKIELARHADYWGPKPHWDNVTFMIITNDASRVAALLSGTVQAIDAVPTADIARLKNDKALNVHTISSNRLIHLHIDTARDVSPFVTDKAGKPLNNNPLRDIRVRRAFSKAINRDALVQKVMEGSAVAAGQLMPEGMFGYVHGIAPERYDPEGARKLLTEAGYADGFGLTLHGPNNRYINDEQILQAVAQNLSRIGISAKVAAMPMSVFMTRADKADFSVALLGLGMSTGEASYPLRFLLATWDPSKGNGRFNLGRYSNSKVDDLISSALATIDDKKRERLLQQASDTALNDYALIPLHFQVNHWALRKPLRYLARIDERTYAHSVLPK